MNSKQYCDFQVMFTEIQTKSKDFAQNQNGWFFNDSNKIVKKFSQMQNLGQLGPENCRAYVFFAWCGFVCLFVCFCFPLLLFFLSFFLFFFFFYSSPDLNLHWYSILHDFSFKNTKFSASEIAHPLRHPCVCKYAIGADAPPNHPPMSKTDVQPSVVLVY